MKQAKPKYKFPKVVSGRDVFDYLLSARFQGQNAVLKPTKGLNKTPLWKELATSVSADGGAYLLCLDGAIPFREVKQMVSVLAAFRTLHGFDMQTAAPDLIMWKGQPVHNDKRNKVLVIYQTPNTNHDR